MKKVRVVIETRETQSGAFTADVGAGPMWLAGAGAWSMDRENAARNLREQIEGAYPEREFEFIHAESR